MHNKLWSRALERGFSFTITPSVFKRYQTGIGRNTPTGSPVITRIFRVHIDPAKRSEFEAKFATISVKAVRSQNRFIAVEIGKAAKWTPD